MLLEAGQCLSTAALFNLPSFQILIDWDVVLHPNRKQVISEMFPKPISWFGMEKQNLTQQKQAFTNQNKCTTTENKHKKLKPGLVAMPSDLETEWAYSYFDASYICKLLTYLLKTLTHLLTAWTRMWPFQRYPRLEWVLQKRLLGINEADLFTCQMSLLSPDQQRQSLQISTKHKWLSTHRIVHTAKVLTLHVSAKKTLTVLSRSEIANSFWSALQHTSVHRQASTLCHNRQYRHWTRANVITASCRKHGTKWWWNGSGIGLRSKAQRFNSWSTGNDSEKVVHTFVSLSPSSIIWYQ